MSDVGIPILITLGFGVFMGAAYYGIDRSRYGTRIACKKLSESVVLALFWIVFISWNSFAKSDQWNLIVAIILMTSTVLMWIVFIVLAFRRPQTGTVLLNLGRLNKDLIWMSLLLAIGGLFILFLSHNLGKSLIENAEGLSVMAFSWSAGIIFAAQGLKEFLVTEKGMRTGYTGFQWEDVKYYLWSDEDKNYHYLFFRLKRRPLLLNTCTMKIPEAHRQAVRELISQYAAGDAGRLATESSA